MYKYRIMHMVKRLFKDISILMINLQDWNFHIKVKNSLLGFGNKIVMNMQKMYVKIQFT